MARLRISKRDAFICMEWVCGKTMEIIALEQGISIGRVGQIKDKCFRAADIPNYFRTSARHSSAQIAAKLRPLVYGRYHDVNTPEHFYYELLSERTGEWPL